MRESSVDFVRDFEAPSPLAGWVLTVGVVAFVAVICAALVHFACTSPPLPLTHLDPGTPRAEYCAALSPSKPWLSLTLGPTAVVALLGWPLRARPWALLLIATLVCAATIADVIVVRSLADVLYDPVMGPLQ